MAGHDERRIWLIDTTLRDGEQTPGVAFSVDDKVQIAGELSAIGVPEIEVGTPIMGGCEARAIAAVAALDLPSRVTGWCRCRGEDLDAAEACGLQSVHLSLPVSRTLLKAHGRCFTWVLRRLMSVLPQAIGRFEYVSVGAQDASRADAHDVLDFAGEVEAIGANRVRLADTVGVWHPSAVTSTVMDLRDALPKLEIAVHCHNDLGLATANAMAAIEAGADAVDVTVNGLGERTGNAPLEQVAVAAHRCLNVSTGLRLAWLGALCRMVAERSGRGIPAGQPITGEAIFSHESGVHVHALLAEPATYEPFCPADVGHAPRRLTLGKHSGTSSLRHALWERGVAVSRDEAEQLLPLVREAAVTVRREISVDELLEMRRARLVH